MACLLWGCMPVLYAQRADKNTRSVTTQYAKHSDRRVSTYHGLRTSQYAGEHHLIGTYINGAYSNVFHSVPTATATPGGFGTGAGIVYEFQHSAFMMQVGVGVQWQTVTAHVGDTVLHRYNVSDPRYPNDTYDLKYQFSQRTDQARTLSMQVPLLFGGTFAGGYCFAGVKLNYALAGSTVINAVGTTTATSNRYVGEWGEMDNNGFRKDVPLTRKADRLDWKLDVMASLELGYEFSSHANNRGYRTKSDQDVRFRIGAFVDYGLLNTMPAVSDRSLYHIPDDALYDFPNYQLNHIFTTDLSQGKQAHNFFVGLKFTILYCFQAKEECLLCFDRPGRR